MTKVKVFVYGLRQQRQKQRRQRRGYEINSPDFRHGELKTISSTKVTGHMIIVIGVF